MSAAFWLGRSGGRSPASASAFKGAHLGGRADAADVRDLARDLVGLPFIAGEVRVGGDGALGGGQESMRLETHLGGEDAGAFRPALEAAYAIAVFVAVLIGDLHGEVAGLGDL